MRSVIVGAGEIGLALERVLGKNYLIDLHDPQKGIIAPPGPSEILHVCFPYTAAFVSSVIEYQTLFTPHHTVIHSTVPVGISRHLNAIHSPIRGLHPFLSEGIETFSKFIGGDTSSEVADYFRKVGIRVVLYDKQETTEALKLFDTEYYRVCIEFCLRVKAYCDKHSLNFHEVYTLPNMTYNEGYANLGHSEFMRPVLQPIMKEIGGHCVLPNKKLIEFSEK